MKALSKKYGPLPVWGWGVAGVAVLILYLRYRATRASGPPSSAAQVPAIGPGTAIYGSSTLGYDGSVNEQLSNISEQLARLQALTAQGSSGGVPPPVAAHAVVPHH